MIHKETIRYKNINFDFRYSDSISSKRPLILFLHGFKSFRNWGFIPHICSELASNGFLAVNMDFEYNGITSENPVEFDVERFAKNTLTKEFENASVIIELYNSLHNIDSKEKIIKEHLLDSEENFNLKKLILNLQKYWNGELHLIGHSRGGGIALLCASKFSEIKKVALLAPIAHFDRYTERMKTKWKSEGFLEFNDTMSKQQLRINASYIYDLDQNENKFELKEIAKNLKKPVLIIHGENDVSVPQKEAKELYNSLNNSEQNITTYRNFVLIKKANHLFNINHPFRVSNIYLDEVCDLLIKFFLERNEKN